MSIVRHSGIRRAWSVALVATMASLGCARQAVTEGYHPQWPAAPAAPRLVHRRNVHGPADLAKSSFLDSLGRMIVGNRPQATVRPAGVAVQGGHRLLVTDQELQGVHVLDLKSGRGNFLARAGEQYFVSPVGAAACGSLIAVADGGLEKVFLMTPQGKLKKTIDRPGGFGRPTGVAFDAQHDELYVVDTVEHQVCVFDLEGGLLRVFGGHGTDVGQFNFPTHVFVDAQSRVYVTDSLNFRVQVFDRQGGFLFHIGRHGDASGHLGVPKGVAVDSVGHIYVVDSYFSTVQIFDRQGQFLLNIGGPGSASGQFQVPTGLTIDAEDRVFVCDSFNSRVQVFQYVGEVDDEHEPTPDR